MERKMYLYKSTVRLNATKVLKTSGLKLLYNATGLRPRSTVHLFSINNDIWTRITCTLTADTKHRCNSYTVGCAGK